MTNGFRWGEVFMNWLWSVAAMLFVGVALLFVLGCATEPDINAGHYTLTTVNGQRLPVVGLLGLRYVGGSVELRNDSTFVDVLVMQTQGGAIVVDSMTGRYVVSDSIRFTPTNYGKYAGYRDGARLSVSWAEGVFTYKRD
jgi:hypothetical protein